MIQPTNAPTKTNSRRIKMRVSVKLYSQTPAIVYAGGATKEISAFEIASGIATAMFIWGIAVGPDSVTKNV